EAPRPHQVRGRQQGDQGSSDLTAGAAPASPKKKSMTVLWTVFWPTLEHDAHGAAPGRPVRTKGGPYAAGAGGRSPRVGSVGRDVDHSGGASLGREIRPGRGDERSSPRDGRELSGDSVGRGNGGRDPVRSVERQTGQSDASSRHRFSRPLPGRSRIFMR